MRERKVVNLGKTNTAIMRGEEDLSLWSDEELKRGQRRDKNGNWSGRPPKVVPLALYHELNSRTMRRVQEHLRDNLEKAVEALTAMIGDPDVDDGVKVKAIDMVLKRVLGNEPMRVELSTAKTQFEQVFEDMVVYESEPVMEVIEAQVVEK